MPIAEYVGASAINSTNGNPITTGATLQVSFNGGTTFAAPTNTPTHKANGWWSVQLTSSERDNAQVDVQVTAASAVPQTRSYVNVPGGNAIPITEAADGQTVTSGTVQSGSFTDTATTNGVYFQIAVAAGAFDVELFYDLPTGRIGQAIIFSGRFDGGTGGSNNKDFIRMQVYNYTTAQFEERADIVNTKNNDITWAKTIPRDMTAPSTDPNPGRVRIKFILGEGDNGDDFYIDECTVSAVLEESVSTGDLITAMRATIPEMVYQDGAVWVDTIRGSAGRIIGFNGTPFGQGGAGPSNNVTDAIAIAAQLNTRTLRLAGDSKFTLDQSVADGLIIGEGGATVELGGQDVSSAVFRGCVIDGIATFTGTPATYNGCILVNATTSGAFVDCRLQGAGLTLNSTLNILDNCFDFDPGGTTPTIDCNNVANLELKINDYTGRLKLINVAATATVSINDLDGYLDISDASVNAAATFVLSGIHDFIGTPNGTITQLARLSNKSQVVVDTGETSAAAGSVAQLSQGAAGGLTQQQVRDAMALPTAQSIQSGSIDDKNDQIFARTDVATSTRSSHSAADVWTNPARTITGGTVTNVTNEVTANATKIAGDTDGATRLKDHALTAKPVTFSGGTTTTAVMATVGGSTPSSTNDQYKGAILIFNAGSNDEVRTDITAYDGTTKVATITAVPVAVAASQTAILV